MSTLDEITDLEERLREAELGPVLRVWLKKDGRWQIVAGSTVLLSP